jgi:hypothetical protein
MPDDNGKEKETKVLARSDVDANTDIVRKLAWQSAESAFDKELPDSFTSSRRELKFTTMAFVREEIDKRIAEFKDKNNRQPNSKERIDIIKEVRKIEFLAEVKNLRCSQSRIENILKYHQEHGSNPEFAFRQMYYEDIPKMDELEIIIGASIPDVIPLKPSPKPRDVITKQIAKELTEVLDEEK